MKSLLLIPLILLSCYGSHAQMETILAGKITHPNSDSVWITTYDFNRVYSSTRHACAIVNDKGRFKMEIHMNEPMFAYFWDGKEQTKIYLEPGDNQFLFLDTRNFDESIRYIGKGSEHNNFLAGFFLKFEDFKTAEEVRNLWNHEPTDYITFRDSIFRIQMDFWKDYEASHEVSERFSRLITSKILYDKLGDRMAYPFSYQFQNEKDTLELPKEYFAFFGDVVLNDDELVTVPQYGSFVWNYLGHLYESEDDGQLRLFRHPFYFYIQKKLDGKLEYYTRATYIMDQIHYHGYLDIRNEYYKFIRENPYDEYNRVLVKNWSKREKLEPGNSAPEFRLQDLEGREVSLSDFRGKVVFIDFWSTGCGPCIKNIPYINKVRQHFVGKDVIFLYISVINNPEDIRLKKEKHRMEGIHLIADNLVKARYQVSGIPAYFLVDREGILAGPVPRPADTESLIRTIESLLE